MYICMYVCTCKLKSGVSFFFFLESTKHSRQCANYFFFLNSFFVEFILKVKSIEIKLIEMNLNASKTDSRKVDSSPLVRLNWMWLGERRSLMLTCTPAYCCWWPDGEWMYRCTLYRLMACRACATFLSYSFVQNYKSKSGLKLKNTQSRKDAQVFASSMHT